MDDSTKSKLQALFDADKARKAQLIEQANVQKDQESAFLIEFLKVRDEIIAPEMQKMADFIINQGWNAEVVAEDERLGDKDRTEPASIRMMVGKDASQRLQYRWHENAYIRVVCEKRTFKAGFHECTIMPGRGGMSGGTGTVTLAELTPAYLEQRLATFIAKLFK